jgi:conserved oligomeric Golgi complex subunit 6
MSVYQSSMLGDEHEDERDTGFRQVLDIMVTPVSSMCISNGAQKKTVRPEWDDKVFVLNCLCYLQVWFSFRSFRLAAAKRKILPFYT